MSISDDKQHPPSLLRRLLKNLSLDWLSLAFDATQSLRRWLCTSPTRPYEILDYKATVELLDTTGVKAVFRKQQRVKFLQNSIIAFEDYAWGDGDILAEYQCAPGVVVDKYKEGDRWNILVSLRDTKSIGDVEQSHIEQKVRNTYLKDEGWLQTEIRRHTRHLTMSVMFPQKRHCKRAIVTQRSANRTTELGLDHFDVLPDGGQLVSWETNHVRSYEVYTLKWRW
jgi:hypothetical protein